MKEEQKIIEFLLSKGYTKWKIAKEIGVSWRTVRMWQKGFVIPKEINLKKLKNLKEAT